MKFFNLDLHISVIADIKNIFEELGHSVNNWSISGHHHLMGWEKRDDCVVNSRNWENLDGEMCDQFYETYKNHPDFIEADAFITTHTPSFSLLYKKFNKPIIAVCSTRYEAPFSADPLKWAWFNAYLKNGVKDNRIWAVANNKYDQEYLKHFTGIKAIHIPSYCGYTKAERPLIPKEEFKGLWISRSRFNMPDGFIHINDLKKPYIWQDIANFSAILHIPYNVSVMSIFEQYTANVPLIFPTIPAVVEYAEKGKALTEISWNQVKGLPPLTLFPGKNLPDYNNYKNYDFMGKKAWLADFYDLDNMPHIRYFNGDELQNIINQTNWNYVSNEIKTYNITRKLQICSKWKTIIEEIREVWNIKE